MILLALENNGSYDVIRPMLARIMLLEMQFIQKTPPNGNFRNTPK